MSRQWLFVLGWNFQDWISDVPLTRSQYVNTTTASSTTAIQYYYNNTYGYEDEILRDFEGEVNLITTRRLHAGCQKGVTAIF